MTCIVCTCQGAWELARRMRVCVHKPLCVGSSCVCSWLTGYWTQCVGESFLFRRLQSREPPSVTPPVNSDFHHRGLLPCSTPFTPIDDFSVFFFTCFRVSLPLPEMGSCVKKKKQRRGSADANGLGWMRGPGMFLFPRCHLGNPRVFNSTIGHWH